MEENKIKNIKPFKTNIGQRFVDDRRDYEIVEQRRGTRHYNKNRTMREVRILCHRCNQKNWMAEERVLPPRNCACNLCRYYPKEEHSIVNTDPWMITYFPGGYDEAKQYSRGQGKKINFICPFCGKAKEKAMAISTLARTHSVGCTCPLAHGRSFSERLFREVLDAVNIRYIREASHMDYSWIGDYFYDYYLIDYDIIVELHGKQHYGEGTGYYEGRYEDILKNDRAKELLAHANLPQKDNYIVIDCRRSEVDFIKDNMLKSNFFSAIGISPSTINWVKVADKSYKSEKLEIKKYIEQHPELSVRELADIYGVSRDLIKEIQVYMGVYNAQKERALGVKRQNALTELRIADSYEEIVSYKCNNPELTTEDIAGRLKYSRGKVRKALKKAGMYDKAAELDIKHKKLSQIGRAKRDIEAERICSIKRENPSISNTRLGKMTGHGKGYIQLVLEENGLDGNRRTGISSNVRRVRNIDTGEIFENLVEAAKTYGIHKSSICNCCNGKLKTAGGFRWEYVDG